MITAYLVWGELGDLFRSGAVEAPRAPRAVEEPLLANPSRLNGLGRSWGGSSEL